MTNKLALVVGLALASIAAPAFAGDGFIRVEAGRSDVEIDIEDFASGSDTDTSYGVRGGYWFMPNLAVEAFYSQLYSTSFNDGFDTYRAKLHAVGVGLAAKKNYDAEHQGFFISGRAGIARGVITAELDGSVEDSEASSAKPYFGVGAGYDFSERFGLSVNYDRLQGDGDGIEVDVDNVTLGLEMRF